jgi:hypothetical protein
MDAGNILIDNTLYETKLRKMSMIFGMWNVRSLYRAGSLMKIAKELTNYALDLARLQEVRCDRGGTEPAGVYIFLYGNGNENNETGTGFFSHIRESCLQLRGQILFVTGNGI